MSGQPGAGDKTEKATPRKLRKARQDGQAVRSRDLATALGVLVSMKLTIALLPGWIGDLRGLFALSMADLSRPGALPDAASMLFPATLLLIGKMLAPLAAVPVCIVLGSLFPGGWMISAKNVMPKASRLSPAANLKRLVSGRHCVQVATTVLKAALLIATLALVCRANLDRLAQLRAAPLAELLSGGAAMFVDSTLVLCAVLAAFALIDAPLQRMLFLRGQRMSKRDIKDEMRQTDGKPEVKGRIRQLQRQLARQGIRKTVPGADVVIVNPTHYAVALKYDEARAQAPFVVAKGVDETALFIREVANRAGVEVLELPPLARAIHHTSQVNQQIPAALYRAVAQVLTYVLQIQAFRRGARASRPALPAGLEIPEPLTEYPS